MDNIQFQYFEAGVWATGGKTKRGPCWRATLKVDGVKYTAVGRTKEAAKKELQRRLYG